MSLVNQKVRSLAVRGNIDARTLNINGTAVAGIEVDTEAIATNTVTMTGGSNAAIDIEVYRSGKTGVVSVPAYALGSAAAAEPAVIRLSAFDAVATDMRCVKFIQVKDNGAEVAAAIPGVAVMDGRDLTIGPGLNIVGSVTDFTISTAIGWAAFDIVFELV